MRQIVVSMCIIAQLAPPCEGVSFTTCPEHGLTRAYVAFHCLNLLLLKLLLKCNKKNNSQYGNWQTWAKHGCNMTFAFSVQCMLMCMHIKVNYTQLEVCIHVWLHMLCACMCKPHVLCNVSWIVLHTSGTTFVWPSNWSSSLVMKKSTRNCVGARVAHQEKNMPWNHVLKKIADQDWHAMEGQGATDGLGQGV